jgi:YVTN family beta-propeller protein
LCFERDIEKMKVFCWTSFAGLSLVAGCAGSVEPNLSDFTHPGGTLTTVALSSRPFGIAVSAEGTMFATRLDAAAVTRFEVASGARTADIGVGSVPTDVAFSPDGRFAYVTNQGSGNIGVIEVAASRQITTIQVEGAPFRVVVSRDGSTVIASSNADKIFVIDAATRLVVRSVSVCADPNGLAINKSGRLLHVGCPTDGRLMTVDLQSFGVTRSAQSAAVQEILLSPDEQELYVARLSGGLEIRRASDLTLIATVDNVPSTFGMALSPDGMQLYATETLLGTVAVIDRGSRQRVATIQTGGAPRRVAFSRRGDTAVVANEAGFVHFIK